MVASASWAGGIGGCPLGRSWDTAASSAWNGASNSACRPRRKHTNHLARLIRRMIVRSVDLNSTDGG
jgi:hypothetical protein